MKTPAAKTSSGKDSRAVAHHAPAKGNTSSFAAKLPAVAAESGVAQLQANRTGLPDQLKSGIEQLSGYSMDNVKVHYNSSAPAQLQAHAYAQGTDIHVAPGQEKHLPHEAWHVVQQKQGRVQATTQLKSIGVNDSPALEREADVMGAKALQGKFYTASPAQLKTNKGVQVAQLTSYRSKTDHTFTVEVNAGNGGSFAVATHGSKKHEQSSLPYAVMQYTKSHGEGGQAATGVRMATQTDTMHSYPEKAGIGTLIASEAMQFLEGRNILYFQPDEAMSSGGKVMAAMISGTKRSGDYMADLIARTDGREAGESQGCGCWAAFTSLFSSKKKPEKKPLIEQVRTYPAIEVNYGATRGALAGKVAAKFDVI